MASGVVAPNDRMDNNEDDEVQFLGEIHRGKSSTQNTTATDVVPPNDNITKDDTDNLQVLRKTYQGKELVLISDSEEQDAANELTKADFVREGHFRLMDLPAELRNYIYSFFLPTNLVITHFRHNYVGKNEPFMYDIDVLTKNGNLAPLKMGRQDRRTWRKDARCLPLYVVASSVETSLFRVSKFVSNEARGKSLSSFLHVRGKTLTLTAILYGSNVYEFRINSTVHQPTSLRSTNIFGQFGSDDNLPLLRNLRSICIDFVMDSSVHWAVKRQRARLDFFVEILKAHADDENRRSLLQELTVNVRTVPDDAYVPPQYPDVETFMFGLESLAALRGIKDVRVTGVPEWFARCLQVCIRGKGGEVVETDWPQVQIKRKVLTPEEKTMRYDWQKKKFKTAWVTTRKWWQPVFDWKEFAERNGIEVPEDIDQFWTVSG